MANPYPIKRTPEEHHFHPKDALKSGVNSALIGGGAGFFASAIQNSLAKRNIGPWTVFTKTGGTIATFTAAAAMYGFGKDATANLREKDDTVNVAVGAFLAGSALGLRVGRVSRILGYGTLFSVVLSTLEYTGGGLRGKRQASELDEYDRKEALRKNRRRPITETIENIGEGRGIYPPGYEERRRQRLKEKYGVEINPVSATVE
ncbi:NADH-ubiquinone oxidoreductase-like protein [Biscogniauxia mediterranea]|nr:NADH-ubiquinone oxidoreductase-like protein [Biscogniauxia mediterranea]